MIRKGETFLILEAGRYPMELRVVTCRTKKPKLAANQIAIKLKLVVPKTAFDMFCPTVTIEVPDHSVLHPVITLEETGRCDCEIEHEAHIRTCPECEGAVR